jgi:hypothetical protein
MSWTLCTSGACVIKAGKNASSSITASGAQLATFSDEAEAFLAVDSRYDWVGNYASVKTNFKQALADVCSDIVASKIVNYDIPNYGSIKEATTLLDVLRDNIERALKNLRDDKYREVMIS